MVIFVFDCCGKVARVTWIFLCAFSTCGSGIPGIVCWGSFVAILFSLACILSAVFAIVFVAGSGSIFWCYSLIFELFFAADFVPLVSSYMLCVASLYSWLEWCCLPLHWIVCDCGRSGFSESIAIVRRYLCVICFFCYFVLVLLTVFLFDWDVAELL
jgi:hypothetical protein